MMKRIFSGILSGWARYEKLVWLAALIFAILFPVLFTSRYIVNIGILCLLYVMLSLSLNLITGYMGVTTLGHAAFFGAGAYTAALLSTKFGAGFIVTLLAAAVVAAIFGLMLGAPTLRVSGRYLTIVTMGFCEIMRLVELNWISLTRGPMGIPGIPAPALFGYKFSSATGKYYVALVLVVLTILVVYNITNSRVGRCISAIKGDNLAAEAMGINTKRYKLIVFLISGAIAGMAGAFYAHYMSFIDPSSFSYDQSVLILSMTILGGLGSIPGSIIGAILLTVIPELLRDLMEWRQIIYGLILALMVIYRPQGLVGGFNLKHIRQRDRFSKLQEGGKK